MTFLILTACIITGYNLYRMIRPILEGLHIV